MSGDKLAGRQSRRGTKHHKGQFSPGIFQLEPKHLCGTCFHADAELFRTPKLGSVFVMLMAIAS